MMNDLLNEKEIMSDEFIDIYDTEEIIRKLELLKELYLQDG